MKPFARYISLLFCLLTLASIMLRAQQAGIYIPKQGKVFLADTAVFFSSVINEGNLGLSKNAVLDFKGKRWENDASARITNATDFADGYNGEGGKVRFAAEGTRQQISGGYNAATKSGPRFYDVEIANGTGIELSDGSTRVAHEVSLQKGLVYLNNNLLVVGHGSPGQITGYNENRYFVTGSGPGSGFLIREGLTAASGLVTFPVGTTEKSYTPAAVRAQSGQGSDFGVSVFDGVRTAATMGRSLAEQSVGKTWQLTAPQPSASMEVVLQHQATDEGTYFAAHSNSAYVAGYNMSRWDTAPPLKAGLGILTTGSAVTNSRTHSRLFSGAVLQDVYLTKFAAPDTALKTKITLYGYRIDAGHTRVNWGTQPEVKVHSFVVQRMRMDQSGFVNVDTVMSMAAGGFSTRYLYYQTVDDNNYTGVTYYRLLVRTLDGGAYYSETIAIGGVVGEPNMMLWPNPTPDECYVSINTTLPVKSIVVWDAWGQKLYEEPVNGRRILRLSLRPYAQSMYVVGILSPAGQLIATEKVIRVIR